MPANDFTHDELVEFAIELYGEKWRDTLAQKLNISRKQLVLTLAAGDPIPEFITVPFLSLLDAHVNAQVEAVRKMETRVAQIRSKTSTRAQPRVARKTAS